MKENPESFGLSNQFMICHTQQMLYYAWQIYILSVGRGKDIRNLSGIIDGNFFEALGFVDPESANWTSRQECLHFIWKNETKNDLQSIF